MQPQWRLVELSHVIEAGITSILQACQVLRSRT